MLKGTLAVLILTYNEQRNIRDCLESLKPLATDIYIVDSGSTDYTLDICREYTSYIFQHPFENYAAQRNWAFDNLPVDAPWLLNMDADHRLTPELAAELKTLFSRPVEEDLNGFLISRKTLFMGKWIKHGGHYPTYHAILFRKGWGACEDKLYDQHFKVTGRVKVLEQDMIDIITDSINTFINRHNHWAKLEAAYQFNRSTHINTESVIKPKLWGNPIERRRYFKHQYEALPLFVRPALYFLYRYFLRLGFLDGKTGLIFHFLQGFWFRFLIDSKIYELQIQARSAK